MNQAEGERESEHSGQDGEYSTDRWLKKETADGERAKCELSSMLAFRNSLYLSPLPPPLSLSIYGLLNIIKKDISLLHVFHRLPASVS